jgi:hypothetical protein
MSVADKSCACPRFILLLERLFDDIRNSAEGQWYLKICQLLSGLEAAELSIR